MANDFNKKLEEIEDFLEDSMSLPFASNKYIVNGDKLKELIDDLRNSLPAELKKAREVLDQKDAMMAKIQSEANVIIDRAKKNAEITLTKAKKAADDHIENARIRAEEMIDEQQITEAANERARQTVEQAKQDAIKMREVTINYLDKIISQSEKSLEASLNTVVQLKKSYTPNNDETHE